MTRPSKPAATPRPVTPQRVRAVLRKAGLSSSKWLPQPDRRGHGRWSPGHRITWGGYAERYGSVLIVRYDFGDLNVWPAHGLAGELARIASALSAAGLACEVRDGAVRVMAIRKKVRMKLDQ